MSADPPRGRPNLIFIAPLVAPSVVGPRAIRARRLIRAFEQAGYFVQTVTLDDGRLGELDPSIRVACAVPGPSDNAAPLPGGEWQVRVRASAVATARRLLPLPDAYVRWGVETYRRLTRLSIHGPIVGVYAIGFPFTALVLGAAMAKRWRVPLIADMGDPWPVRGPAEALLARRTLGRASALIVPTELMAEEYRRIPSPAQRIVAIPNGADRLWSDRSQSPRPLFLHAGTLSHVRIDPAPAFRALAQLDREGVIEFRSYGSAWVSLPTEAVVHHHGPVQDAHIRQLMARATATLILGNRSPIGVPSKSFEVARSNVWGLFVTELEWELGAEILEQSGHGGVVRKNEDAAIREMARSLVERDARGERPEPTERYSWDETSGRALSLVREVTGTRDDILPALEPSLEAS